MNAPGQSDTTPVRPGHGFDEGRLTEWLKANLPGFEGPLAVEQFKGGQSNPTYLLRTPGALYVLRRKPPGLLLKGAHAVDREARVLAALGPAGFAVAALHATCLDESVIGSWFYVMAHVAGRIFWDPGLPDVKPEERPLYFDAMGETIARLHRIDPIEVGLGDYGRPGNYYERQIARWAGQYRADEAAGRDDNMDRLAEWLPEHIPPGEESAVVHGDFRCDNLIFDPGEPRVLAVLDWELSTLGHPLADFAYHAMMYRMPAGMGLGGVDLAAANIPDEASYVAAYARRTGRALPLPGYEFAICYNLFRLAAILHGIKGRVIRGTAASASARERAASFAALASMAWAQAGRVAGGAGYGGQRTIIRAADVGRPLS